MKKIERLADDLTILTLNGKRLNLYLEHKKKKNITATYKTTESLLKNTKTPPSIRNSKLKLTVKEKFLIIK